MKLKLSELDYYYRTKKNFIKMGFSKLEAKKLIYNSIRVYRDLINYFTKFEKKTPSYETGGIIIPKPITHNNIRINDDKLLEIQKGIRFVK